MELKTIKNSFISKININKKLKNNNSINIYDYVSKEKEDLTDNESKRLNYLLDVIIRKVYKNVNPKSKFKVSYHDYICSNDLCERIFNFKEQKKIKNYLDKYFIFRNIPVLNKLDKKYNVLNNIINELEYIIDSDINSYDDLMGIGHLYYNRKRKKNKFIDSVINSRIEKLNTINKEQKKDLNGTKEEVKKEKKVIVTSDEIKDLKSTKNKLLYRIRKLENQLLNINYNDTNKVNYLKHELKICKLAILELENDMLNHKQSNDMFDNTIINNYDKRYENSLKSVNTYIRRNKKDITEESIYNYFGDYQINYFKSLGIDINSLLNEAKNKKKR